MKSLSARLGALFLAFGASSAAWAAQPLLTPSELDAARRQPSVRVIDIRPPDAYAAGHIPGAVSAPYAQWRGPANNPGQLPPLDRLTQLVRGLGVDRDTHAVVVSSGADGTDFGASARVYWTLKYLGLKELSVLNGGLKAWADAGLPQDQAAPSVAATAFEPKLDESIIATTEQVAAQVGNSQVRLVDARPLDFYLGKVKAPTAQVPGTIQGAVNVENGRWFKPGTSIFVSADEARKIAAELLPDPKSETISFCNTGHWAATDWFALSEIVGQKNVRLYPESMAEWSQDPNRPMEHVPGRGSQILDKLKGVFG
ncbi:Sulfurtransferase OS=Castellaniella defragrans (strain DSM / CCUG 39792 / 65Phen) OX=1437824 GN=BN940_08271 PE=4 SV=1 [Castellaniella denitrificans]|uniref:sulfurtransferase n=1 Tax=Castellaniella denitrificans TaxID=56119 RepID=UPI003618D258